MNDRDNGITYLNQNHMKFAEFFASIGLMRVGLELEGWTAAFANDIDQDKFDMYSAHFGENEPFFLLEDIHKSESL